MEDTEVVLCLLLCLWLFFKQKEWRQARLRAARRNTIEKYRWLYQMIFTQSLRCCVQKYVSRWGALLVRQSSDLLYANVLTTKSFHLLKINVYLVYIPDRFGSAISPKTTDGLGSKPIIGVVGHNCFDIHRYPVAGELLNDRRYIWRCLQQIAACNGSSGHKLSTLAALKKKSSYCVVEVCHWLWVSDYRPSLRGQHNDSLQMCIEFLCWSRITIGARADKGSGQWNSNCNGCLH